MSLVHARLQDAPCRTALLLAGAAGLVLFAFALNDASGVFGYDYDVIEMPVPALAALLATAGAIYFAAALVFLPSGERASAVHAGLPASLTLGIIVVAGLAARLILFASEPMLEDDYQRYLWDGAVTANGFNPYTVAPQDVFALPHSDPLAALAAQAGPVLERINHPHLTTIYPPGAQALFALAALIEPFSVASWRGVLLLADVATLLLLAALLSVLGKSWNWVALYWWNPIVLKELFNSAHMEALLFPFLAGGLYYAVRSKPVAATLLISIGAGIKLWPALLLPLIWRFSVSKAKTLALCLGLAGLMMSLWLSPFALANLDDGSGLVAYASGWVLNNPLYKFLLATVTAALELSGFSQLIDPARATRVLIAVFLVALSLFLARARPTIAEGFLLRILAPIAALTFLSPAVYPWYTLWMLPILVLVPVRGLLLFSATIPLYYLYFYFAAREATQIFHHGIVYAIWLPVWGLTLYDILRSNQISAFVTGMTGGPKSKFSEKDA